MAAEPEEDAMKDDWQDEEADVNPQPVTVQETHMDTQTASPETVAAYTATDAPRRGDVILDLLRTAAMSQFSLAHRTGYPEASIRRTIQELRRIGYTISDARDTDGQYRLTES